MILNVNELNGYSKKLNDYLNKKVISQEVAIRQFCNGLQKYFVGLNEPKKPLSVFLFAGPTGSGKTKIVKDIAQFFNIDPVIINCSEYQQNHETLKLLGAPPGYIGHADTKPIFSKDRIERSIPNVVLFDEIEKASSTLYNLLLGILDNGYCTTSNNIDTSFENCFIFMTCNIGISEIETIENNIGFTKNKLSQNEKESITIKEIKKQFSPEFINRLDKIVVFEHLDRNDISKIFDNELELIQNRISHSPDNIKKVFIEVSSDAKEKIVDEGYSVEYGARNLKRAMETHIVNPIANALSLPEVLSGDSIKIGHDNSDFLYEKIQYNRKRGQASYLSIDEIQRFYLNK